MMTLERCVGAADIRRTRPRIVQIIRLGEVGLRHEGVRQHAVVPSLSPAECGEMLRCPFATGRGNCDYTKWSIGSGCARLSRPELTPRCDHLRHLKSERESEREREQEREREGERERERERAREGSNERKTSISQSVTQVSLCAGDTIGGL